MDKSNIPKRAFGKTGIEVTITDLGGEGALRTFGQEDAAHTVIRAAIDQGIAYFDSTRAYAGSETYYGLVWPEYPEERARVIQASKSGMVQTRVTLYCHSRMLLAGIQPSAFVDSRQKIAGMTEWIPS